MGVLRYGPKDDPDEKGIVTLLLLVLPLILSSVPKMTPMKRGLLLILTIVRYPHYICPKDDPDEKGIVTRYIRIICQERVRPKDDPDEKGIVTNSVPSGLSGSLWSQR